MLLGVACFFLLPARPEATKYLTEEEREMAIERMNRSSSGDTGAVVNRNHVIMALKDWRVCIAIEACVHSGLKKISQIYIGGVIYFGANTALASISAFLPTIIKTFGYSKSLNFFIFYSMLNTLL